MQLPPVTKGGRHALDNLCGPYSTVAVRSGYFLYHGWSDPYSARYCYHYGTGKRHFRAEGMISLTPASSCRRSAVPELLAITG